MPTPNRLTSNLYHEANKAMLALAGFRQVKQGTISVTAANTQYTVTEAQTRRIVLIHGAAAYGDIRFNINANATASSLPVLSQRYFVVDAKKGDVINLIGTGAITVNYMEID